MNIPSLTKKNRIIAIAGGVALLVAMLLLITPVRTGIVNWFSFAFAPQEVKDMLFLTGTTPDNLSLSRVGFGMTKVLKYEDKNFVEVVEEGATIAALLKDASGKTDVYKIEETGEATPLTSDGREKKSLAISPDGTRIAFSYVNESSLTVPLPEGVTLDQIFDITRYELAMIDSAGQITSHGEGLYAHFINNETLFAVSAKGLSIQNLTTGEKNVFADPMVFRMVRPPVFIDAETFVVQNSVNPQFDAFKITSTNPLQLSVVEIKALAGFDATKVYALSSDEEGTLYGLTVSPDGKNRSLVYGNKEGKEGSFRFPNTFIPFTFSTK